MTRLRAAILFFCFATAGWGAQNVEELRLQKRFALGMSAGGPLSLLGLEADVNLSEDLSIGGGIGTGGDYSTLMFKARFLIPGKWVSPYFAAGAARWWSQGTNETKLGPGLMETLLPATVDPTRGFELWMVYPAFGVEFMHPTGVAFFAEIQYLIEVFNLANGPYAGVGLHWYF